MATMQWCGGLSVAVMLLGPALNAAELPIPAKIPTGISAKQPARPMGRTCIGTDGKAFQWDQPNVPFAAVCSVDPNGPAPPPPSQPSK